MIKKILFVLAITFTSIASFAQKPEVITVKSPGDTTVLFTVKTVTYGGAYAPKHVFAIWITNSSNQYVTSLEVRGVSFRNKLNKWNAASGGVIPADAISGASLLQHVTHTVKWNGKNKAGYVVPDGDYNFWVEFNETNYTSGNPSISIPFTKGPADQHVTPANNTYFQNIDLQYFYTAGYGVGINSLIGNTKVSVTPNPTVDEANIMVDLTHKASVQVSIYSISGKLVHRFNKSEYEAGKNYFLWNPKSNGVASGTYFVHVTVDQKNQIFKLIVK
jgi:flagellar hook assembly protein FlgD